MQFRYTILVIFFSLFLLWPISGLRAESLHFNPEEVQLGSEFVSQDSTFKLSIPAEEYTQPIDVYLYKLPSAEIKDDINSLTEIYSYYIYSSEVNEDSEFTITISYHENDHASGKTIYYYNSRLKKWQMASNRAFLNNLTFKLSGKKNKLVVVGTNLALTANNEDKSKVSDTFNFDVNQSISDLEYKEVCLPYLTNYFKSNKTNSEEEVKKLQTFLREYEGFSELPSTGYYGNLTYGSVKQFQEKYAAEVLAPWGLSSGTGWVLGTTLEKINQVYCAKTPDSYSYEVSIPYSESGKQAKSAYFLNGTDWEKLESFDDYRNKTVTAILKGQEEKISLFEETDGWVGEASWYSWKGGLYAASRDFPKGTKLKVTNQSAGSNRGKSVIVEVNDYGPELWTGRIIDLDKVAFNAISNLRAGVTSVKIEVID